MHGEHLTWRERRGSYASEAVESGRWELKARATYLKGWNNLCSGQEGYRVNIVCFLGPGDSIARMNSKFVGEKCESLGWIYRCLAHRQRFPVVLGEKRLRCS